MAGREELKGKKIYNDLVDEQIDLDNPEEVLANVENLRNQQVDEVHPLSDASAEDVPSPQDDEGSRNDAVPASQTAKPGSMPSAAAASMVGTTGVAGNQSVWLGYNPNDYRNLNISPEIKDLFQHITNYVPEVYELETHLKPFIPEYIPAIGEVDAFIKIPRPDGEEETLGISIIDEPKLNQSKRHVLELILRDHGKLTRQATSIHSVANAHKNPKEIQNWIDNVGNVQKERAAPAVVYSSKMPDIDSLMQAWDPEYEKILDENPLPDIDLNIPIEDLTRAACAMLDIPIHENNKEKSLVESTHLLFSLYSAFNQFYQGQQSSAAEKAG